ncbi:MAG: ATP-binding protein, partial [Bacteroidota bacterium]
MSHEIRTPMNAIIGFTKLLYHTRLTEEQREYLQAIDTSGEALIAIINDILDLSKIEAGMLTFEEKDFSLRDLLNSIVTIFRPRAAAKTLELTAVMGPGVPEFVIGDQVRLNQVLLNLVGNAIKFTADGEVTVEVKLMSETSTDAHLLFEVSDTGIGIPYEKQKAIFESFTQASSETTRKFGGTGLGLTICKRIVELQDGNIGVQSEPGEGSSFYFDLHFPKGKAADAATSPVAKGQIPETSALKVHVLLAEDNAMNQRLASKVLENCGFTYEIVANGREALERIAAAPFDVVLMDIQMPEMDGYEATRRIRAHQDQRVRCTPIIALTAHAMVEEANKVQEAGMDAFVSKPFNPENLRATIIDLIEAQASGGSTPARSRPAASASDDYTFIALDQLESLADGNHAFKYELIDIFLEEGAKAIHTIR